MNDDERVLVCYRVADTEGPATLSRVGACERCGAAIWIALSSPADVTERICFHCLPADEEITVAKPTAQQFADVRSVIGRNRTAFWERLSDADYKAKVQEFQTWFRRGIKKQ